MEHRIPFHPESLLEHGPRLRALARRLVRDDHAADDLVQETWVRAVERGPASGATPWQWLARVLRNLAFQDHRLAIRRAERERAVARVEGGDERQRFGMHRELVGAIESLADPYRQTILLRYFDALPPRRIAARLGVPVKTVKTRLNRGMALLRAALDREHGGREQWLAAMLPLARMGGWPWTFAAPALTAGGTLKLAAAAVVAGVGTYLAWPEDAPSPVREVAVQPREAASPELARLEPLADAGSARVPSSTTPAANASPSSSAPAADAASRGAARSTAGIHARVLDPDGAGLPGVLVGFEGASEVVRSGSEGEFDLPYPDSARTILCRDERFATVLAADVDPGYAYSDYIVVVAPAVTLAGVVLSDGPEFPAPNARVAIEVPLSFRGRFRAVLDHSPTVDWSTRTDEQGRFSLEGAPGLACARLGASDAFGTGSVPVPEGGSTTIEIACEPGSFTSIGRGGVQYIQQIGEVRHADGRLAPWTLVAVDGRITRSDDQALFEVTVPGSSPNGTELVAVARGEQPARFTPARAADGTQLWPTFVTLVLGPPARAIAGTVYGTDGEPLEAAQLWIEDLSYVGAQQNGFVTLEQQMAGERDGWRMTQSGPDGRFELHGLLEREYRLAAMDLPTLQIVRVGPIAAGTEDVHIAFPTDGLWERVRGRVVDRHGPRAGIAIARTALSCQLQSPRGSMWGIKEWLPEVTTDELGHFELARVPREGVILSLREFPNVERALAPDDDPLDVVIEVPYLAHLQIELGPDAPADGSIVILDAEGTPLTFYVLEGGSVSTRGQVDLANENEFSGGRTPALAVPDTAAAVVLRDEHKSEVRRVSVVLGEELTSVRL